MKERHFHVYEHNFGIVIPCKSNTFWQHQTMGVQCHQIQIEGIFIPLGKPKINSNDILESYKYEDESGQIYLLEELKDANYDYDGERATRIWKQIKESMKWTLTWENASRPDGQPRNQEGLQWIKVISFQNMTRLTYNEIEGTIVALLYPNSD